MLITREQIKGARAMLDWSQKELAKHCPDVSEPTIKLIELGKVRSTEGTLNSIRRTLEQAGIEFTAQNGVRFRDDIITVMEPRYDNDNLFLRLLDDVFHTLREEPGILMSSFIDHKYSTPEIREHEDVLRKSGVEMRFLIRHGDTNLIYPIAEYRYLPKDRYINSPTMVYGDKFAVALQDPESHQLTKIVIIRDSTVAAIKRQEFEIIWDLGKKPGG